MTNKIDKKIPPLPAPLSLFKLHSPEVQRQHRMAVDAHYAALDEVRREAEREAQAAIAHASRVIDANEYWALAQARENSNRAREAARQAVQYAEEQAKIADLTASPEVAEILATNPVQFIAEFESWVKRGYTPDLDGPVQLAWNLCHLRLKAPTTKKTKAVAA